MSELLNGTITILQQSNPTDEVLIAEGTPFAVNITRHGPPYADGLSLVIAGLVEEILILKQRVKALEDSKG